MINVCKTTVLLAGDMSSYPTVNKIYAEYFPVNPPARAAFAVAVRRRKSDQRFMLPPTRTVPLIRTVCATWIDTGVLGAAASAAGLAGEAGAGDLGSA